MNSLFFFRKAVATISLALLCSATAFAGMVPINPGNFPDENFRAYLLERPEVIDMGGGLMGINTNMVFEISVSGRNILNLIGIEYFTELEMLSCGNNLLYELNLQSNTKLQTLQCDNNFLGFFKELDLSANTALQTLYCGYNRLSALDLSANTALQTLYCPNNQLPALDLPVNIKWVNCNNNRLTALDLSGHSNLTDFYGANQTADFTLTGTNDNASLSVYLNNPTDLADGLTYSGGVLTSTSTTITSSPFIVETNNPAYTLNGTLNLSYDLTTSVVETGHTPTRVTGYYSILGIELPQEPESGLYIILYDNGKTEKVVK